MNIAGILLIAAPGEQAAVRTALAALPWAELHQRDAAGRMIVTVEAGDTEAGLERLKSLKRLPGVLSAEMVIHCFEDEAAEEPLPGAAAEQLNREDGGAPRRSYYNRLKALSNS